MNLVSAIKDAHRHNMRVAKLAETADGDWLCILAPRKGKAWHIGGGDTAEAAINDAFFSFERKGGKRLPETNDNHLAALRATATDY